MAENSTLQLTGAELSVEWKIKNFFSLPKVVGYKLESPTFQLSDARWCLGLFPNGRTDKPGWVSMFLYRKSSESPFHSVDVTFEILTLDGSEFVSENAFHEYETNIGWGWPKFVEISKIKDAKDELLEEETLNVFCTVRDTTKVILLGNTAVERASQTPPQDNVDILQKNFEDLFKAEHHGDITVKVQNQGIPVHMSILTARSPVFFSMFDHDTEEKRTGVVTINDFQPDTIMDFLKYLYSAKVDITSYNDAIGLYKAADKYGLEDLKAICVRCLTEQLTTESFCSIVLLAAMHGESELLETATSFFIDNLKAILTTAEWQSLGKEHFTVTNELLIKMANKKCCRMKISRVVSAEYFAFL